MECPPTEGERKGGSGAKMLRGLKEEKWARDEEKIVKEKDAKRRREPGKSPPVAHCVNFCSWGCHFPRQALHEWRLKCLFEMKWAKQQSIIEAEREEERKTALCCLNDSHYSRFSLLVPWNLFFFFSCLHNHSFYGWMFLCCIRMWSEFTRTAVKKSALIYLCVSY